MGSQRNGSFGLGKLLGLSEPQFLHLRNGLITVPTSQLAGKIKWVLIKVYSMQQYINFFIHEFSLKLYIFIYIFIYLIVFIFREVLALQEN